ncbi:MAG TPA: Smr/MutS family protein [Spirochaetota bacterium]|nr:Smr/MutS family protein [Spirochaetota bacterium]HOM37968.1 Smr/MutS family protein [Spirochaetota bacterium]HPQ48773.1 Smr/MutS family protein [Spirochaetota bacterium]
MNELEEWLKNNQNKIKDYLEEKNEDKSEENNKKIKIDIPEIDLHGLTLSQAIIKVKSFILEKIEYYDKIRIIHGKGKHSSTPVLRDGIREWLEKYRKKEKLIKDYSYEKPENGGTGATIVWLLK